MTGILNPDHESIIQRILRTNILDCLSLNYEAMAVPLMRAQLLTHAAHQNIQQNYVTNGERIGCILNRLKQENSSDSFHSFIECCQLSGKPDLATRLDNELKNLCPAYRAMQTPQICKMILSQLGQKDLLVVRGVSQTWNTLALERLGKIGEISFNCTRSAEILDKFVTANPTSQFVSTFRSFIFPEAIKHTELQHYMEFFRKYGRNIRSITLSAPALVSRPLFDLGLDDFTKLFFTEPVQSLLGPLETLVLATSLKESHAKSDAFSFKGLHELRSLTISASGIADHGQISFLEQYVRSPRKLTHLKLQGHFCIGDLPRQLYSNIFKNCDLEGFESSGFMREIPNAALKVMTLPAKGPTLKTLTIRLGWDVKVPVLHRFLLAHRATLRRVDLDNMSDHLMESIPEELMPVVKANINAPGRADS